MISDPIDAASITSTLPRLLKKMLVTTCTFYELPMPPPVELRGANSCAIAEAAAIARERKGVNDSFIETLLEVSAEKSLGGEVLDAASFHQPLSVALNRYDVQVQDLDANYLQELCKGIAPDALLVLSSLMASEDGVKHLPMLDLKLTQSSGNDCIAMAVSRFVGGGLTVSSGSSYHHYGQHLMVQEDFEQWLLRSQLLSKYIDGRWVTHQLIEKQAALRISHRGRLGPPTVISEQTVQMTR